MDGRGPFDRQTRWTTVRHELLRAQTNRPINCYYEELLACKEDAQHSKRAAARQQSVGFTVVISSCSRNRDRSEVLSGFDNVRTIRENGRPYFCEIDLTIVFFVIKG